MSIAKSTGSITAENTGIVGCIVHGDFNVSISGTWAATVYLQKSYDSGGTWLDVSSYAANANDLGFEPERGVRFRLFVKTGGFTSGAISARISQ